MRLIFATSLLTSFITPVWPMQQSQSFHGIRASSSSSWKLTATTSSSSFYDLSATALSDVGDFINAHLGAHKNRKRRRISKHSRFQKHHNKKSITTKWRNSRNDRVECNPNTLEADVGILRCGSDYQYHCEPDNASSLGGFCVFVESSSSTNQHLPTSRHLQDIDGDQDDDYYGYETVYAYDKFCLEDSPYFEVCDCSNYDTNKYEGTIVCESEICSDCPGGQCYIATETIFASYSAYNVESCASYNDWVRCYGYSREYASDDSMIESSYCSLEVGGEEHCCIFHEDAGDGECPFQDCPGSTLERTICDYSQDLCPVDGTVAPSDSDITPPTQETTQAPRQSSLIPTFPPTDNVGGPMPTTTQPASNPTSTTAPIGSTIPTIPTVMPTFPSSGSTLLPTGGSEGTLVPSLDDSTNGTPAPVVASPTQRPTPVISTFKSGEYVITQSSAVECDTIIDASTFWGTCCALTEQDGKCKLSVSNGKCKVAGTHWNLEFVSTLEDDICPPSEFEFLILPYDTPSPTSAPTEMITFVNETDAPTATNSTFDPIFNNDTDYLYVEELADDEFCEEYDEGDDDICFDASNTSGTWYRFEGNGHTFEFSQSCEEEIGNITVYVVAGECSNLTCIGMTVLGSTFCNNEEEGAIVRHLQPTTFSNTTTQDLGRLILSTHVDTPYYLFLEDTQDMGSFVSFPLEIVDLLDPGSSIPTAAPTKLTLAPTSVAPVEPVTNAPSPAATTSEPTAVPLSNSTTVAPTAFVNETASSSPSTAPSMEAEENPSAASMWKLSTIKLGGIVLGNLVVMLAIAEWC